MADKLCTARDTKLAPDLSLELNTNNVYYSKLMLAVSLEMFYRTTQKDTGKLKSFL